jgi:carbon monoxide dehydrogenase subunit G
MPSSVTITFCGGGRPSVMVIALVLIGGMRLLAKATGESESHPGVTVHEERGVYTVQARFHVPQPPAVTLAVLMDYEQIPRFMPGVRTSVVLERATGRAVVEQEAVSRVMMFSKRVHLVLEITEKTDRLRFRDRCGRSFVRYEGMWRTAAQDGGTDIVYDLTAQPSFAIPEFLLTRLLRRDSGEMIEALRRELAARSPD